MVSANRPTAPTKRPRFFVENLLNMDGGGGENANNNNNNNNNNARPADPIDRYIRRLDVDSYYNKKFEFSKWKSSFLIENAPADAQGLLRGFFKRCIDEAIQDAFKSGVQPDKVGVEIFSRHLDPEINLPFGEISANVVEAVLNRFLTVAQSKTLVASLWGEPFMVRVTAVASKELPLHDAIRGRGWTASGGGGGVKRRTKQKLRHRINERVLIRVQNQHDSLCLFYAMMLTMLHNIRAMEPREFWTYLNRRQRRQATDVNMLLTECGIPANLPDYDAKIFAPRLIDHWNREYAAQGHRFCVFVFGAVGQFKPDFRYGPIDFNVPIALFHSNNHFDGIRGRSVGSALFERDYYCFSCEMPLTNLRSHTRKCRSLCKLCGRLWVGATGGCVPEPGRLPIRCVDCCKVFTNGNCFLYHHTSNFCASSRLCEDCGTIWSTELNNRDGRTGHVCHVRYCTKGCGQWHRKDAGCYIAPLKPRKQKPYRLIAYDFETYQHQRVPGYTEGSNRHFHTVNFCVAYVCCTLCILKGVWRQPLRGRSPCHICGSQRLVTFSERPFTGTEVDRQIVDADPLRRFVQWILFGFDARYPTVAIAHNGGKFDVLLLMREFFNQTNVVPQMIRKSNKIYSLSVGGTKRTPAIDFKDSLNWFQCPLGALVGAFGLQTAAEKPFFPYLANHPRNLDFPMPTLPPKSDYFYGGMMPERQRAFDQWYAENYNTGFFLPEALAEYAVNDVLILIEALIEFRSEFWTISCKKHNQCPEELEEEEEEEEQMEVQQQPSTSATSSTQGTTTTTTTSPTPYGGIDILKETLTLASAAMKHYKLNYLETESIGICPAVGYDTAQTQSTIALKYIEWLSEQLQIEFQTAHSPEGEYQIPTDDPDRSYTVDAWSAQLDLAVEVNGCVFHGCPHPEHGWDDQTVMPPTGKTAGWHRQKDAERLAFLRNRLGRVDVVWECEIHRMLARDPQMKASFARYQDAGPLKIRSCFYGGRTQVFRLHYKAPLGQRLYYFDVRSLYPSVIASIPFPLGHPDVVVVPARDRIVNWTRGDQVPIKGLLKVFVVPPSNIDVSVLPVKFPRDSRLLTPLCRACALRYPEGAKIKNYRCPHNDDFRRGWVSECVSSELALALDNGYRVIRHYRHLSWPEDRFSSELFREYVADFFTIKTHASGFPDGINTREQEDQYIRECEQRFGVRLDRAKMVPNKAKRTIGKLFANCLWGRFGLNPALSKTLLTQSPAEVREHLDSAKVEVTNMDELTEELLMLTYNQLFGFVEEGLSSNPIISLWTTAHARIRLHGILQKVARDPNCVLLYCDTDSVIFAGNEEGPLPLELGPHLGDLSDEFPEHIIREFICSGPKCYGLRMQHKETGQWKYLLHIKGLTLTAEVCKKIHWATFKKAVLRFASSVMTEDEMRERFGEEAEDLENLQMDDDDGVEMGADGQILIHYENCIRPSVKTCSVQSVSTRKLYRPVIAKGIVTEHLIVKEFGSE